MIIVGYRIKTPILIEKQYKKYLIKKLHSCFVQFNYDLTSEVN